MDTEYDSIYEKINKKRAKLGIIPSMFSTSKKRKIGNSNKSSRRYLVSSTGVIIY